MFAFAGAVVAVATIRKVEHREHADAEPEGARRDPPGTA